MGKCPKEVNMCRDCQEASLSGTNLLLSLTQTGRYTTLCQAHRTELANRMQGSRPKASKSNFDYSKGK